MLKIPEKTIQTFLLPLPQLNNHLNILLSNIYLEASFTNGQPTHADEIPLHKSITFTRIKPPSLYKVPRGGIGNFSTARKLLFRLPCNLRNRINLIASNITAEA